MELGKIYFKHALANQDKKKITDILKKEGFELLEDRESKIINQIKSLIISRIHHQKEKSIEQNFSNFLADSIGIEYSQISKLFSNIRRKKYRKLHHCTKNRTCKRIFDI